MSLVGLVLYALWLIAEVSRLCYLEDGDGGPEKVIKVFTVADTRARRVRRAHVVARARRAPLGAQGGFPAELPAEQVHAQAANARHTTNGGRQMSKRGKRNRKES